MTKLDITYVSELFLSAGLNLLSKKYEGKTKPLLCEITTGRLAGYQAELSLDSVRQRLTRGKGGDFTLRVLTSAERERYMKTTAKALGYTIVKLPENGKSTAPMEAITPVGKRITTTWNTLENNFAKTGDRPIVRNRGEQINDWATKYQVTITKYAETLADKLTYIHQQGEYANCEGSISLKSVLQLREPTLRSLTEKGLVTYYSKLCSQLGVKYLGYSIEGLTRTTADIIFLNTKGVFAGYKGVRSVGNIRQSIDNKVTKATIELLTSAEKCRFMSTFSNDNNYTVLELPDGLKVTNKILLVCPNGHQWSTTWDNFYRGNRCPRCSKQFKGESLVRTVLQEADLNFKEQVPIRTEGTTKFQFLDFFIPELQLAIEYNGRQHYESVEQFGGATALQRTQILDQAKRDYCIKNGITLLEIPYTRTKSEVKEIVVNAVNTQQAKIQNNFE